MQTLQFNPLVQPISTYGAFSVDSVVRHSERRLSRFMLSTCGIKYATYKFGKAIRSFGTGGLTAGISGLSVTVSASAGFIFDRVFGAPSTVMVFGGLGSFTTRPKAECSEPSKQTDHHPAMAKTRRHQPNRHDATAKYMAIAVDATNPHGHDKMQANTSSTLKTFAPFVVSGKHAGASK